MVIRVGTDIPCQPNLVSTLLERLDLVIDIGNQPLKFTNRLRLVLAVFIVRGRRRLARGRFGVRRIPPGLID